MIEALQWIPGLDIHAKYSTLNFDQIQNPNLPCQSYDLVFNLPVTATPRCYGRMVCRLKESPTALRKVLTKSPRCHENVLCWETARFFRWANHGAPKSTCGAKRRLNCSSLNNVAHISTYVLAPARCAERSL